MDQFGDHVDQSIFSQILEMDEDDSREFSKQLVEGFFEQAIQTFDNMDNSL